ncbi:LacI family DNA-binding transcriptional regulator [Nonomuraea fuscirosea]|jgi:DNA-binding LacI/PurR family transcriptional regulator|uniref:LacI family DNA-binding transcriptional regulator n=1 Tax=Nonomuraea fuscirosea TaxID=1291556 RepID=UPI002DDA58D0|nr:LacI family DNA-binding transcriptional regulator [Nonomuraea fuscirosea]WSA55587.1 LacI family DNA-binding transcriptional regulator [Nonomuraea fuscirosea]
MAVTTGQDQDPGPEPGTGSAQRGGSGVPGGRRKQRVSMADVAQRAGVSSQTVSRVSNGHPGVIDSTREQVLKAMRELGYRPNSAARALRYGQFNTIGVILFGLSSTGNSRTVEAIATHAAAEGYAITLTPIDVPTQDNVLGAFTRMGELAVDAVIVIIEVHLLDAGTVTLPPGVHAVVVDSDAGDRYSVVDTDQADGARRAVHHLLGLGHRTVWHVTGPRTSYASQRRAQAWRDTLREAGRPVPEPLHGDWSAGSGYAAGLTLADEPSCTAVFAANDQMALGLLRAFHERGRAVPGDISVVGFDDISDSAFFVPPLTTVHQDFAEVGRRCVQRALAQIRENEASRPGTDLVPTRLVIRASTAPPRRP